MIGSFRDVFKIPELRSRIGFTIALLVVYRVGGHILLPGVNQAVIEQFFEQQAGNMFKMYDMFAGGNLRRASIFALGIMPYISASIIMQLATAVVPYFEKLQKEGEDGRKRINQLTRYGTVALGLVQSAGISRSLPAMLGAGAVTMDPNGFMLLSMLTLTAGTVFVMWLGEQITERGIGNGISLIITIGIVARYPRDLGNTLQKLAIPGSDFTYAHLAALIMVTVGIVAGIVAITQGERRIPVQYARRMVGRKTYGGQQTHIPLKVNTSGVMPIIFAQSLLMAPSMIAGLFPGSVLSDTVMRWSVPTSPVYVISYAALVIGFSYFYTAIVFNPVDLADNMKKYGGFIPGIKPGKKTAEYIDRVLTRITLPGGVFLAFIAIMPAFLAQWLNAPIAWQLGGTGLLIVVGVVLDTMQQVESHLVMRSYEGFMKSGRVRGRR
jgi:preprotein translocase subunit SecY